MHTLCNLKNVSMPLHEMSQQTRKAETMLGLCWAGVVNVAQHKPNNVL